MHITIHANFLMFGGAVLPASLHIPSNSNRQKIHPIIDVTTLLGTAPRILSGSVRPFGISISFNSTCKVLSPTVLGNPKLVRSNARTPRPLLL